ncbi:hypothetical protein BJV77DRAFT_1024892 [Russula vinacea]|nr:hypothetical protein BJV77DRAFT_1024892 [Russula vinacea]
MATQNHHAPDVLGGVAEVAVNGVIEVTGPLIGRKGDYFMDRSRDLLRRHIQLIELREQDVISRNIHDMRDMKNGLDNFSGSRFQRLIEAKKYRRLSKVTYKIIKIASERGIDRGFMDQIADAMRQNGGGNGSGGGSGSGPGTAVPSIARNPFTDSHAVSTLTDITVNDLEQVEMTTYQVGDTSEAAVVLDLVAQDKSVQHVVATFPTEAFTADTTDGAPAALSLHREDGTVPHLVTASPPDLEVESRTVVSMAITETSEDGSVSNPYGAYV